jgi:lycopene epsilon-cyclase
MHIIIHAWFLLWILAGKHPNAGEGLWGSSEEGPSFLYAMPLGGNRVFLEETCLVAKPAMPFAVLKRRLQRRLDAMDVKVKQVQHMDCLWRHTAAWERF